MILDQQKWEQAFVRSNIVRFMVIFAALSGVGLVCSAQTNKDNDALLPPDAKPGSCYARVFVEPTYETASETIEVQNGYEKVSVTPSQYGTREIRTVVREATTRLEVIPATYTFKEDRILVREASKKIVPIPAVWETKTEQVLEHAAYRYWKRGRAPVQRVANATGEVMCLVEVPAKYRSVSKRVLVTPATTREEEVPAEYETVRRQVTETMPTTRTVEVPAEYQTLRVRTISKPSEVQTVHMPEEFQRVITQSQVTDGHLEWKPVLCETNINSVVISELQTKLKRSGNYNGPIDGVLGTRTSEGISSYQRAKGLPRGGLTLETLERMGIRRN